ncbi:hypothetical protein F4810DRAFT_696825 [Camillea tinctor]|nr:hypothetical protein F4810DRAFT_696825 [Camillea tinctor]
MCHESQTEIEYEERADDGRWTKTTKKEPRFYMSRESFEAAERHLKLPIQTLPNFGNMWGIHSSEIIQESDGSTCIDITMRSPYIPELPRVGISLSHNFSTRTTTAFFRGFNAIRIDHGDSSHRTFESRFSGALNRTAPLWHHPLLLPVIFIHHELAGIREFSREKLRAESENIRERLKTRSYEEMADILGGYNNDADAKAKRANFIQEVNDILCAAISVRRALQTTKRSIKFLMDVLDEISQLPVYCDGSEARWQAHREIRDLLRGFDSGATGFEVGIEAIISTMEVQLDVLSTVASQLDNNRSAQMGAQAGMDSVAMKTLALVTAVFLPATFIATLFSMSMFDWQADTSSSDGGKVVSDRFWIFWTVSIPLTIIVLGAWWLWWDVSKFFYASRFKDADGSSGTQIAAFKEWAKYMRATVQRSNDERAKEQKTGEKRELHKGDGSISGVSTLSRTHTSRLEAGLSNNEE